MNTTALRPSRPGDAEQAGGFTLIELLVVVAVIAILAGILLPTFARSKARAQGVICLSNTRQLLVAWLNYADDHNGRLTYNLVSGGQSSIAKLPGGTPTSLNWADNVLNWGLEADNTNATKMIDGGFGFYAKAPNVYRCPADRVVSDVQRAAGWGQRVRSYSMNAMIGDLGGSSPANLNANNPDFVQFIHFGKIPQPANIFVFLDEHPDSIGDGNFVNRAYAPEWVDLPASYHDGAANLSFADGHAEAHRWRSATTRPPARPGAARLPIKIPSTSQMAAADLADFYWIISRMSVEHNPLYSGSGE
jgi:prepilin-type N-terminal cleavage/methylation domain-containing protein/prepilin-type processing-associated H-X9-DG protein